MDDLVPAPTAPAFYNLVSFPHSDLPRRSTASSSGAASPSAQVPACRPIDTLIAELFEPLRGVDQDDIPTLLSTTVSSGIEALLQTNAAASKYAALVAALRKVVQTFPSETWFAVLEASLAMPPETAAMQVLLFRATSRRAGNVIEIQIEQDAALAAAVIMLQRDFPVGLLPQHLTAFDLGAALAWVAPQPPPPAPVDVSKVGSFYDALQAYIIRHTEDQAGSILRLVTEMGWSFRSSPTPRLTASSLFEVLRAALAGGSFAISETVCRSLFAGAMQLSAWQELRSAADRCGRASLAARAASAIDQHMLHGDSGSQLTPPPSQQPSSALTSEAARAGVRTAMLAMPLPVYRPSSTEVGNRSGVAEPSTAPASSVYSLLASAHVPKGQSTPADTTVVLPEFWQRSVRHLIAQRRFDTAVTFCGVNDTMQAFLVSDLMARGEHDVARAVFQRIYQVWYSPGRGVESPSAAVARVSAPVDFRLGGSLSLSDIGSEVSVVDASSGPGSSGENACGGYWSWPICIMHKYNHAGRREDSGCGSKPCAKTPVFCITSLTALTDAVALLAATIHPVLGSSLPPIIGIDAEWRPSMSSAASSGVEGGRHEGDWPVSLLQIAQHQHVFLIDMLALRAERPQGSRDTALIQSYDTRVRAQFGKLFGDSFVKIGFGLQSDLIKLLTSYSEWFASCTTVAACVDVATLACTAAEVVTEATTVPRKGYDWVLSSAQLHATSGLSSLCHKLLGRPLLKTQQTSDWQRRPLSPHQLQYAALDAAVLLVLFDASVSILCAALHNQDTALEVARSVFDTLLLEEWAVSETAYPPHKFAALLLDSTQSASTLSALGPPDVAHYLQSCGMAHTATLTTIPSTAAVSAEDAAAALGCSLSSIVKSLAFMVANEPIIALVSGNRKVDPRKLADVLGCSRQAIRMATAQECVDVFGYTPGTFPPFGYRRGHRVKTLADTAILAATSSTSADLPAKAGEAIAGAGVDAHAPGIVFAGGGALDVMVRLTTDELQYLAQALVVAICKGSPPPPQSTGRLAVAPTPPVAPPTVPATATSTLVRPYKPATAAKMSKADTIDGSDQLTFPPQRPPLRFAVDEMLGRLRRWLRVIGVDAESADPVSLRRSIAAEAEGGTTAPETPTLGVPLGAATAGTGTDTDSASGVGTGVDSVENVAAGEDEEDIVALVDLADRILITRDRKLFGRKPGCALFYTPFNDTPQQFEHITQHFDVTVKPQDLMSRCAKCNGQGYEFVNKESARAMGIVPAKVLESVDEYWKCKRCGKLYWEGPKFADAQNRFSQLFEEKSSSPSS